MNSLVSFPFLETVDHKIYALCRYWSKLLGYEIDSFELNNLEVDKEFPFFFR